MEPQQKRAQIMLARLYDAALHGDVNCLINLLQEDSLILDRCIIEKSDRFVQSPLHVAADLGHLNFVKEITEQKPQLIEGLNRSRRSSPALHMAVIKGHLHIVKELVAVNTNICLVNDQDGLNPVQVAAIRGKTDELKVLALASPQAARERTTGGDTVLHLCAKYGHPRALECLLDVIDDFSLLNAKDGNGNTVLHLAVLANQLQMVQLLLTKPILEANAMNNDGFTAMDAVLQTKNDRAKNKEIIKALSRAKGCSSKDIKKQKNGGSMNNVGTWLERQRNALMVVASLIATMAFQVGVNPPGGAWQDEKLPVGDDPTDDRSREFHLGGSSIMATLDGVQYNKILVSNTIAFISSLSVILLLISGLPCQRLFVALLMIIMWIAITATTLSYVFSIGYLSQTIAIDKWTSLPAYKVVVTSILVWLGLIMILLVWHGVRFISALINRWILRPIKNLCARASTNATQTTHPV